MATDAVRRVPTGTHVVRAIAGREIRLAARRRLLRWLFGLSIMPLLIFATILIVRVITEETVGRSLPWDPVLRFLQVQVFPVTLLALGLGTPIIARDRGEDVLFLYATRPVLPQHYTLGKLAAVAVPTALLLLLPGLALTGLRLGILREVGLASSAVMVGKVALASVLLAYGYAGAAIGASAATSRSRWSLLLALAIFFGPDIAGGLVFHGEIPLGPTLGTSILLESLFDYRSFTDGVIAASVLLFWGTLGTLGTAFRVRGEMTP